MSDPFPPPPLDHSVDSQTGNGEVRIGKYYYPVPDRITQLNLARWPPKITSGDYSLDSDPLMSSWILSSFTGGVGNYEVKPGVDDQTYWTGTLETRYPEGPTLLPLTESFGGTDPEKNGSRPIGDFYSGTDDPKYLHAFGDELHYWDATDRSFTYATDLTGTPVAIGVQFGPDMYVPLGSGGYDVIDSALAVTNVTDVLPIHMIVWDRKLCALQADGKFFYRSLGGAWSAAHDDRTVPSSMRARRLVNFINQQGNPTLYVITNTIVYAFDAEGDTGGTLYETRLDYPKHPDQGRAAANFRGDTMFVNVGLGVHGYNGSIITSMGPDGRYGLPSHLRGTIVDLYGEYNGLLALIEGTPDTTQSAAEEKFIVHTPLYRDRYTYAIGNFPESSVFSSIYRWNNSQWHPVWESPAAEGTPTWMSLSESQGEYRLWWGYGNQAYTQEMPIDFQNPKQSLLSKSQRLNPVGELITGWFDADMAAFQKLASHVEVNLESISSTAIPEPGGSVALQYQTDDDPTWKLLGEANTVGMTIMPFRNQSRIVGDPFSRGRPFNRIRFSITETQKPGEERMSPLPYSIVFKFQKIPESQLSWSFTVALGDPEGYKGQGNDKLIENLDSLLFSDEFFEFGVGNEIYRVREAQVQGSRTTGYDNRGVYNVNLLEVKTGSVRLASTRTVYVDPDNG